MAEQNEELDTLRRTNSELVEKNRARKQKIAEYEATIADLQGKLTASETSLRTITIDGPLKAMAESVSTVPELFLEQFSKRLKVELIDGKLSLLTLDGKPVTDSAGNTVPFERDALSKFLTDGDDGDATVKAFRAITIYSRASGAANSNSETSRVSLAQKPNVNFGLR